MNGRQGRHASGVALAERAPRHGALVRRRRLAATGAVVALFILAGGVFVAGFKGFGLGVAAITVLGLAVVRHLRSSARDDDVYGGWDDALWQESAAPIPYNTPRGPGGLPIARTTEPDRAEEGRVPVPESGAGAGAGAGVGTGPGAGAEPDHGLSGPGFGPVAPRGGPEGGPGAGFGSTGGALPPAPVVTPAGGGAAPPGSVEPSGPLQAGAGPGGAPPSPLPRTVGAERERPRSDGRFPVLHKASRAGEEPWQLSELPSPPGIAADEAVLGGLEIRAASVVGPGHRSRAVARQDAYRIGRDRSGRHLIVAVADGMSDSRHSDVGAQVAVSALVGVLREALDAGVEPERLDHKQVFLTAARQLYSAAQQRNWDAGDVRAVAVAAVVPAAAHSDGTRRAWLAAVADVSAWKLRAGAWERLIGEEKGGYDAGAVRHFLPHDPGQVDYGVVELAAGDVLALTTDGVGDALCTGPAAQRWFAERWRRPPAVGAFLLDVGFDQAQMLDDRTAVVVWCPDRGRTP